MKLFPNQQCYLILFDSFKCNRDENTKRLLEFIEELVIRNGFNFSKSDIHLLYGHETVDPQNNGYDCGVFLLYFFERFMNDPYDKLKLISVNFKGINYRTNKSGPNLLIQGSQLRSGCN